MTYQPVAAFVVIVCLLVVGIVLSYHPAPLARTIAGAALGLGVLSGIAYLIIEKRRKGPKP